MVRSHHYCPEWSWWIQSGERHRLGLSLARVLESGRMRKNPAAGAGLKRALRAIEKGDPIVAALRRSGMQLPLEAWCLLQAAEYSGTLAEAMVETGKLLRTAGERRRALLGQLWYPLVVILTGMGVMCIILLWVVPELRILSASMNQGEALPWLTENIGRLYGSLVLLSFSSLAVAACLVPLCRRWSRRSLRVAEILETVLGKLPLLGWTRSRMREGRILRQLSTLLRGGITLAEALRLAAENSPGAWERYQLVKLRKDLLLGTGFAQAISGFPLIDGDHLPLLLAGQESGQLEEYLLKVAEEVETVLAWRMEQWTRAIEPATIIVMAIAVGGLVMAYLLPMVRMLERLA